MIPCAISIGRGNKRELLLRSPILPAAGALGWDPLALDPEERASWGAFTTPPLTWHPIQGTMVQRVMRTAAGYLQQSGLRNPGLRAALRRYGRAWEKAQMPIIVALYAQEAGEFADLAATVSGFASRDCVQGLEVHLPGDCGPVEAHACLRAIRSETELPCVLRLPLLGAEEMAAEVSEGQPGSARRSGEPAPVGERPLVDALVVAAPPVGRALMATCPGRAGGAVTEWIRGPLHSPALAPMYAELVSRVAVQASLPLIGRGGVASPVDVHALLRAGAAAVQLDSILLVHPQAGVEAYRSLEGEMRRQGVTEWGEFLAAIRRAE